MKAEDKLRRSEMKYLSSRFNYGRLKGKARKLVGKIQPQRY